MKKFIVSLIALAGMLALTGAIVPVPQAQAAVKKTAFSEGWLESFQGNNTTYGFDAFVEGWAYDAGKPVKVTVTLQQVEQPQNVVTSSIMATAYRNDVNQYLRVKTKTTASGNYGFKITFPQITGPGHFTIKS